MAGTYIQSSDRTGLNSALANLKEVVSSSNIKASVRTRTDFLGTWRDKFVDKMLKVDDIYEDKMFYSDSIAYVEMEAVEVAGCTTTIIGHKDYWQPRVDRPPEKYKHETTLQAESSKQAKQLAEAILAVREAAIAHIHSAKARAAVVEDEKQTTERLARDPDLLERLVYENGVLSKRVEQMDLSYVAPRDRSQYALNELEKENRELKGRIRTIQDRELYVSSEGATYFSEGSTVGQQLPTMQQPTHPQPQTESLGDQLLKEQEEKQKIDRALRIAEQRREEQKRYHTAIEWTVVNGFSKEIGVRDPLTGNVFFLKPGEQRTNRFIPASTGRLDAKCELTVILPDRDGKYREVGTHVFEKSGRWVFSNPR